MAAATARKSRVDSHLHLWTPDEDGPYILEQIPTKNHLVGPITCPFIYWFWASFDEFPGWLALGLIKIMGFKVSEA